MKTKKFDTKEKKYLSESSKKSIERVTFLLYNDNFQQDVRDLRENLHLPESGLSELDKEKWITELMKETDAYFESKSYLKKVKYLQEKKEKMKSKGRKDYLKFYEEKMEELDNKSPLKSFIEKLTQLRRKYDFTENYQSCFKQYLLCNKSTFIPGSNINIIANFKPKGSEEKSLIIKIYPETTIKDIQREWTGVIKILQKKVWGERKQERHRLTENIDLYIYIADLKQKGKTDRQIVEAVNKKFSKNYIYSDIPQLWKRFKDKCNDI